MNHSLTKPSGDASSTSTSEPKPIPAAALITELKLKRHQLDLILRSTFDGPDATAEETLNSQQATAVAIYHILITGGLKQESVLLLLRQLSHKITMFPEVRQTTAFTIQLLDGRFAAWGKSSTVLDLETGEYLNTLPAPVIISVAFAVNNLYDRLIAALDVA